ncbi:MAG: RimK family alpha-L-glutamate ligase [Alphaproteobacteria bacterium]
MRKVHVIHENDAWVDPLRAQFARLGTPFEELFLDRGLLDLTRPPPEGVFYNRMSASSHTRGHRYAPEYAAAVLEWLARHGRTVVNGRRALALEVSKVAQYQALATFGVRTPDTLAVIGPEHIAEAAERLGFPVILKHNRAGKGLGVKLVLGAGGLAQHLADPSVEQPVDGIWLVQRYIRAPRPFITRVEFVGGRFLYAVRVDTSQGFELCPADQCEAEAGAACPAVAPGARFEVVEGFESPLVARYEAFLAANEIGVAGIEFIVDADGVAYTYDVNTNTNYNPEAEARAGRSGMGAIARHLHDLLHATRNEPGCPAIAAE